MDLSTLSLDLAPVYAGAGIIVGGLAAIWVVQKVKGIFGR